MKLKKVVYVVVEEADFQQEKNGNLHLMKKAIKNI